MATPSTPPTSTATTGATAASSTDVETVTHIQMAGLTVLMVRKKDQVIYKLPDNMSVQSLSQDQRERLLAEINLLHHQQTTAQALAATQAQTQQVQMAQAQAQTQTNGQGVRPIAPSAQSTQTNGVQEQTATTVGMSYNAPSSTSTPANYSLNSSSTITNADGQQKTTRRYNKTGKYSKKKLMQQQILEAQGIRSTTEPYLRPQDSRMKSLQPPQQPLVINNIGLRTYATAAASPTQTSLQQTGTSAATVAASIPVHTTLQSAFLQQLLQQQQQQQQQQQAPPLSNLDQTRQFQLLQEIHQLQQQIEVQQTTTNTFRERELTVQRVLAHHKPVDARTQQLVQQNLTEAEKSLERIKKQLREKEAVFREQFPVFSQQLLVLQHQQQLQLQQRQGAATAGGLARAPLSTTGSTPASVSHPTSIATGPSDLPKTVEAELQQRIKGHHDSVRNAMAVELQTAHRAVTLPDWRTPFSSFQDAIERLLPFHVFQYPAQDLESHAKAFDSRPEAELDTRTLLIHRRKHDLFNKYNKLLKDSATKATTTNPSSALDIIALRYNVEDEQTEYRKALAEKDIVQAQAQMLKHELELRQQQLLQQRRTEAVLIEQQQKLMLERQRLEELEQQEKEKKQRQLEDQIRQLQALQQQHRLGEVQEMQLHMQQQQQQQGLLLKRAEEEEEQERKKEELRKMHQLELEKQLRIKQESLQKEQEEAARAQDLGATTGSTSIPSISSTTPSTSSSSTTASVLPPNASTS